MRVIAGSARGIELKRPRSSGTRPTTGRLRESLFAILQSAGADFSRVLDLYAGSGALGIEALSRSTGTATFVESDRRASSLIRENLERTQLHERASVVTARVERWRAGAGDAYTLVLADPPYDCSEAWREIERAVDGALAPHATIAVEHEATHAPPERLAGLPLWQDRRQGSGAAAVYREAGADERRVAVLRERRRELTRLAEGGQVQPDAESGPHDQPPSEAEAPV